VYVGGGTQADLNRIESPEVGGGDPDPEVTGGVPDVCGGVLRGGLVVCGGLLVTGGLGLFTANFTAKVPMPALLLADTVICTLPALVGEPEIWPVELFTVKPAGNPAAPYDVGLFVAVIL
jgi:hypothetical protein